MASFGNQFRNYGSESVGLNVSIPIFNRMATRNNVRSARIAIRNQELALTEARQALRKEIEQSYYNGRGSLSEISVGLALARGGPGKPSATRRRSPPPAARRSSTTTMPKHAWSGRSRNLVQAKFEFIFRRKILDFYAGEPLGFEKY